MIKDDKTEESSSEFDVTTNQMIFLGLGVLIVILLVMLVFGGKSLLSQNSRCSQTQDMSQEEINTPQFQNAPSLPPPPGAFNKW